MPPTVVASPLKFPLSQVPTTTHGTVASNSSPAGGGGVSGNGEPAGAGGVKRERESSTSSSGGGTPSKRLRVTRKSASGIGEE